MRKVLAFAVLGLAALLTACSGDDAFQKQAYALGQSYALTQKGTITYLQVANPSDEVKAKINRADDMAAPLVKEVLECAKSLLGEPPAPEPGAVELGLDAREALEAKCEGYLSEALIALNALRGATQEN